MPGTSSEHPHYELLEPCGKGGMGLVYRARDKRLNRIVALKFLAPDHDSNREEALGRFQREGTAIAALSHPHIATIYEIGTWDGEPYLALEFLPGGTLKDKIRGAPLAVGTLMVYAQQLASALRHAHDRGIWHRDIKPSNAMFSAEGDLKLVDFGLAKWRDSSDITTSGVLVGTYAYMSPEQFEGKEAGPLTDQYSFGALLFEMATGQKPPVAGPSTVEGRAATLRQMRPDLPEPYVEACSRALAVLPDQRFPDIGQLARHLGLGGSQSAGHISGEAPTITQRRLRKPKRWPYAAAAAGVLIATILAIPSLRDRIVRGIPIPLGAPQTVVVLPVEDLAKSVDSASLCVGLQETVTSLLSQVNPEGRTLSVIPASEVRRYGIKTAAEAVKIFSASHTIAGSLQQVGGETQLVLNLVDAGTRRQLSSRIVPLSPGGAMIHGNLYDNVAALLAVRAAPSDGQPGRTSKDGKAFDLYLRAEGALSTPGQAEAAIQYLKDALQRDPGFTLARAKLVDAYLARHSLTRETVWLAQADREAELAATQNRMPEVLIALGRVRRATGRTSEAEGLFREAIQASPSNVEPYRLLAEIYAQSNRTVEAEKTYQEVIRNRPSYWPTYNSLAILYKSMGKYDEAVDAMKTAIQLAPANHLLFRNLGGLYHFLGRNDEAIEMMQRSIALQPTPEAYSNLGVMLFFQGRYAESAVQAEKAVELGPRNPLNWGNLGDACWQLPAQRERALEAFRRAAGLAEAQLALNPSNMNLRKSYSLYLAKLGRTEDARNQISQALKAAPDNVDTLFMAARVYTLLKDGPSALSSIEKCLRLGYSPQEVSREPDLAELRNSPRWQAALLKGKKQ